MTATVTTPTSDRYLLARISQWRMDNGWTNTDLGWVDDFQTVRVREADKGTGIDLWQRTSVGNWQMFPTFIPAGSVRQAIDLLVALDILPARFARAYEAGVTAGFDMALELSIAGDPR